MNTMYNQQLKLIVGVGSLHQCPILILTGQNGEATNEHPLDCKTIN